MSASGVLRKSIRNATDLDESKRRGIREAGNGGKRANVPIFNLLAFNVAVPDTEYPTQNTRFVVCVLGTAVVALAFHLTLGWMWTTGAGVAGGLVAARHGWLVGLLGVAVDWAVLVGYSMLGAGAATEIMIRTVGDILGNTPGAAVVAATVLIGALLGGLGGVVGTATRRLAAG